MDPRLRLRYEIETMNELLGELDYYQLLQVKPTCPQADVDAAFRAEGRRLHPDRVSAGAPPEFRAIANTVFKAVNDAYRVLRSTPARIEYLLSLEGLPLTSPEGAKVPPALLEEVFELNEELDGIRESRESGAPADGLRARLDAARAPIERRREEHERHLDELSTRWDAQGAGAEQDRRATLAALRERVLERRYIANLLETIDREAALVADRVADRVDGVEGGVGTDG